jgi:(p)ppGpp synthase/HD superfamily hydrolase
MGGNSGRKANSGRIENSRLTRHFTDALVYATELHAGQVRKGTSIPYITHLIGVASLAFEYGPDKDGPNEDLVIAALLHDAVEDQGGAKTLQQIKRRFGSTVAAIVDGCSDTDVDPKPKWRPRKEAYLERLTRESPAVRFVSACDKLHNVRAIIRDYRAHGDRLWRRFNAGKDETLWYYSALVKVYQAAERTPLVADLAREVATLRRLVRARASHQS